MSRANGKASKGVSSKYRHFEIRSLGLGDGAVVANGISRSGLRAPPLAITAEKQSMEMNIL